MSSEVLRRVLVAGAAVAALAAVACKTAHPAVTPSPSPNAPSGQIDGGSTGPLPPVQREPSFSKS